MVRFHQHAQERLLERRVTENEVIDTIEKGETFAAKYDRVGFRRNFSFNSIWREKYYATKQVEAYAIKEDGDWIVITVITKFF